MSTLPHFESRKRPIIISTNTTNLVSDCTSCGRTSVEDMISFIIILHSFESLTPNIYKMFNINSEFKSKGCMYATHVRLCIICNVFCLKRYCVFCVVLGTYSWCVFCVVLGNYSWCVFCVVLGNYSWCVYCVVLGNYSWCVFCVVLGNYSWCVICVVLGNYSWCTCVVLCCSMVLFLMSTSCIVQVNAGNLQDCREFCFENFEGIDRDTCLADKYTILYIYIIHYL